MCNGVLYPIRATCSEATKSFGGYLIQDGLPRALPKYTQKKIYSTKYLNFLRNIKNLKV
jgi:hypothetical protein